MPSLFQSIEQVITIDNPGAAEHVVRVVHKAWPHLPTVVRVRARDDAHASRLELSALRRE